MPIYEYKCAKCGTIEVMQRITDKPLKRCPRCSCKVKKLVSQSSFHLKGSGWYVTDYAKKGAHDKKKSEARESSPTSATSSSSTSTTSTPSSSKTPPASSAEKPASNSK